MLKKVSSSIKKVSSKFIGVFCRYWKKPLILGSLIFVIYVVTTLITFKGKFSFLDRVFTVATILLITWLSIVAIRGIKDAIVKNALKRSENKLSAQRINTQASIVVKLITMVFMVVGLALVLMTFPQIRKIGISILASAGIVGVMVGLAAQKSLGNILSGIQVAFTQPIKIGDIIKIEDEVGVVECVTFSNVVMRAFDRRRVIIPINYFIEKVFQNWTVNSSDLVGRVSLELDYSAPIQEMRKALDSILEETGFWDENVKTLEVINAKLQTIEIRISVSALNSSDAWDLKCFVREKMIEFLQKSHSYCLPRVRMEMDSKE